MEYKNFDDISLQEFINLCKSEHAKEKIGLGGNKKIQLCTGEQVRICVCDFNHDVKENGIKANTTLIFDFPLDGEFTMNKSFSNIGGWNDSYMNNILMPRFFKLLPEELQNAIVTVEKKTSIGNYKNIIKTTLNKLFLMSEVEINGTINYSIKGEGEQYELFKKDSNKIDCSEYFWLRSPCSESDTSFCYVFNGKIYNNFANSGNCVRLAFCL